MILGPVDFSIFKNFQVTEGLRIQFRTEFFNAFNFSNIRLKWDGNVGHIRCDHRRERCQRVYSRLKNYLLIPDPRFVSPLGS